HTLTSSSIRLRLSLSLSPPPPPPPSPLSLHDALPISGPKAHVKGPLGDHRHERVARAPREDAAVPSPAPDSNEDVSYLDRGLGRSEEHTSELQSRENLVCRLLLEKKKKITSHNKTPTN